MPPRSSDARGGCGSGSGPDAVSQLAGAYHGARPGIGLTFAELRAYEPGDDVRHLDWNVTARQGRPFVRRFVEERALSLWLVVDVSASMRFGPNARPRPIGRLRRRRCWPRRPSRTATGPG